MDLLAGAGIAMAGTGVGAFVVAWLRRPTQQSPAAAPGLDGAARAIEVLARTSSEQAEAMRHLADTTARGMQSATSTYVFELRDRFDEALGTVAVGVADHDWRGMAADGTHDPDTAGAPIDHIVFHAGDAALCTVRFVVNQSPVRRSLQTRVASGSPELVVGQPRLVSGGVALAGDRFDLAPDVSAFVEVPLRVPVGDLAHGVLDLRASGNFQIMNLRAEGAAAEVGFEIVLRGVVVPDGDGVGLDVATAEATLGVERRSYWLDKEQRLELVTPRSLVAGGPRS